MPLYPYHKPWLALLPSTSSSRAHHSTPPSPNPSPTLSPNPSPILSPNPSPILSPNPSQSHPRSSPEPSTSYHTSYRSLQPAHFSSSSRPAHISFSHPHASSPRPGPADLHLGHAMPPRRHLGRRKTRTGRYVSDDSSAAYWVSAGWPIPSGGMMEGGMGVDSSDPSTSPHHEASTSGDKRPDSKKCGVCGDRALGYNFNAITCESCKAFFRRNALKNKEFRCPFQDSCKVDQVTRRFCQRCRLKKCFEIGMKKEWIMTDEEKQRKKQKIEENRARKMGEITSDEEGSIKPKMSPATPTAHSPFPHTPDVAKPQAVVVGVIRNDEDVAAKVLRVEGHTDIHSGDRVLIQTTGTVGDRLPPSLHTPHRDYGSDFASSPEQREGLCQEDEYTGGLTSLVPGFLSYTQDVASPIKPTVVDGEGISPFSPTGSVSEPRRLFTDSKGFSIEGEEAASQQAGRESSQFESAIVSPPNTNIMSITDMMAMNIKKEVEYPDETPVESSGQRGGEAARKGEGAEDDTWRNFSIQETLSLLEPGCKHTAGSSALNMMDSIMNTAISAEYSAFSLLGSNNPRELNEPERIKLSELSEANKGLLAPLCEDYNFKDTSNPSLINIINLTEIAIRRLIKMSKRISAFKSLCQEDQIALLKGGCTEMMILRSVCAYDPDKDSWMIQQDHDRFKNIKLKVLKAASGNVYEEHKRFILAFKQEWREDHNLIFLLSAITLFTPERPNIIHADAIKHEQCSYLFLLKRYLECKYGGCEGRTIYLRLLERINHLHILNENHIRVFLEVNPQEVEPLLIEIFDLKQR